MKQNIQIELTKKDYIFIFHLLFLFFYCYFLFPFFLFAEIKTEGRLQDDCRKDKFFFCFALNQAT